MSKQLNAEQKTIAQILNDPNRPKFLIPDYQRPYSWEREQCETLWDDILSFAYPIDHVFNAGNDRYFLGTILTFQNDYYQNEVIDGQQRLITFLLMLRAFYLEFEKIECKNKENILASIGKCIWNGDEFGNVDKTSLKLESEVASDDDVKEFKKILETGEATEKNPSNYSVNYQLFKNWIVAFKNENPADFSYLPMRILNNCILLPIEADNQNTALRIFTTLNDRGMPLSDADIFKAQFYKFFSRDGRQAKEKFIKRWKGLEALCNRNFHPRKGTPVDDLFMRYMYYAKTKKAVKDDKRITDTFSDMRNFYAEDNYKVLHNEETLIDLERLAEFWEDISNRTQLFSPRILKRLYVLSYAPQNIWVYVVSLYFLSNRDLDEENFYNFLNKITAMHLMHAITNPGVHTIRRVFVLEFKDIFRGEPLEFDAQFKPSEKILRGRLEEMRFSNNKPITRAMLAWWTFQNPAQELPARDIKLHQEHIYAKNRNEFEPLKNPELLETLGNKSLLEERINISAADYRFGDKKKYYLGDGKKPPTFNLELQHLAKTKNDFTEADIYDRNEKIFNAFIEYLRGQNLLL